MDKSQLRAKKSWGQHFLTCPEIFAKVAKKLSTIYPVVLEIGPGGGALTEILLQYFPKVYAVEKERRAIDYLKQQEFFDPEKLHLFEESFLKFDLEKVTEDYCIFGNIPYNITSPILKCLQLSEKAKHCVLLMQKEVSERILAEPGDKNFSALTLTFGEYFKARELFYLGPEHFSPPPKVESLAIEIERKKLPDPIKLDLYEKTVRMAFQQRRKTIRNSLKPIVTPQELENLEIDPGARPQTLSREDFWRVVEFKMQSAE